MPEMTFAVRWPDGFEQNCYSPSLVMHDHLSAGTTYTVTDFVDRARTALQAASERVRAKYGVVCTSALGQLEEIEALAARMDPAGSVAVLAMFPPLPAPAQPATALPTPITATKGP